MPNLELVGSAEAADLLEIGPTNFSHLRKKMEIAGDDSFPKPDWELRCGPIWKKSEMLKFKKHYDSRRRRVRSTNGDTSATVEPVETAKPRKSVAKALPSKVTPAKRVAAKPKAKAARKLALAAS
jgi:hypothetical protein